MCSKSVLIECACARARERERVLCVLSQLHTCLGCACERAGIDTRVCACMSGVLRVCACESCIAQDPLGVTILIPRRETSPSSLDVHFSKLARTQRVRKPLNDLPHHTTRIAYIQKIGIIGVPHSVESFLRRAYCDVPDSLGDYSA